MTDKLTSIRVNQEVWKEFRLYCIKNNTHVSNELTRLILERLKESKQWGE